MSMGGLNKRLKGDRDDDRAFDLRNTAECLAGVSAVCHARFSDPYRKALAETADGVPPAKRDSHGGGSSAAHFLRAWALVFWLSCEVANSPSKILLVSLL